MNNDSKSNSLKEKFKQALISTAKVISDDLGSENEKEDNKSSKKFDFFNLENLKTKSDFIPVETIAKKIHTTTYVLLTAINGRTEYIIKKN